MMVHYSLIVLVGSCHFQKSVNCCLAFYIYITVHCGAIWCITDKLMCIMGASQLTTSITERKIPISGLWESFPVIEMAVSLHGNKCSPFLIKSQKFHHCDEIGDYLYFITNISTSGKRTFLWQWKFQFTTVIGCRKSYTHRLVCNTYISSIHTQ